jgi:hypothetical protein
MGCHKYAMVSSLHSPIFPNQSFMIYVIMCSISYAVYKTLLPSLNDITWTSVSTTHTSVHFVWFSQWPKIVSLNISCIGDAVYSLGSKRQISKWNSTLRPEQVTAVVRLQTCIQGRRLFWILYREPAILIEVFSWFSSVSPEKRLR